jgi:hypothetical protein
MAIKTSEYCRDFNLWFRVCGIKIASELIINVRFLLRSWDVDLDGTILKL